MLQHAQLQGGQELHNQIRAINEQKLDGAVRVPSMAALPPPPTQPGPQLAPSAGAGGAAPRPVTLAPPPRPAAPAPTPAVSWSRAGCGIDLLANHSTARCSGLHLGLLPVCIATVHQKGQGRRW